MPVNEIQALDHKVIFFSPSKFFMVITVQMPVGDEDHVVLSALGML